MANAELSVITTTATATAGIGLQILIHDLVQRLYVLRKRRTRKLFG